VRSLSLGGCTAVTLSGYLQALGLLRALSRQADPAARLHWERDTAVLTTAMTAAELARWLSEDYAPSPVVSPWNAGSGFAGNGKSPAAEQALQAFRESASPRFAALRAAIQAGDQVVAEARARGWEGGTFWAEDHKPGVVRLCRASFPDDALPWLDTAVTLTLGDLQFSPLTGTGGNLGRQDLSATFLQRLALAAGPRADPARSLAWAEAAMSGREDVPYLREAVGQYDPGRAGGILSSPGEKADDAGFANPWSFILSMEGTLLFASAVTRRLGSAVDNGAMPFLTRATSVGYGTAASGESKGRAMGAVVASAGLPGRDRAADRRRQGAMARTAGPYRHGIHHGSRGPGRGPWRVSLPPFRDRPATRPEPARRPRRTSGGTSAS